MTKLDMAMVLIWFLMVGTVLGLFIYARQVGKRHAPTKEAED